MNKLNNKGFTLVEVLAVVVILGIIMVIMAPNVSTLLEKSKEDNYEHLMKSVVSAAKMYISDHKYEITVDGSCPSNGSGILKISKIADIDMSDEETKSKIKLQTLIDEGNLKTDNNGNIFDPRDKEKKFDNEASYIEVFYDCQKKGYIYPDIDNPEEIGNPKLDLK